MLCFHPNQIARQLMNKESGDKGRCCPVCGEPIYSRASVHPECASSDSAHADNLPKQPPQKKCKQCGKRVHVRTLVCPNCGAMF